MMNRDKTEFVHARKMLIQDAMAEFINKQDFRDFPPPKKIGSQLSNYNIPHN